MTARVRRLWHDSASWGVVVTRDTELTLPRDPPPVTDLPADVLAALRAWLKEPT